MNPVFEIVREIVKLETEFEILTKTHQRTLAIVEEKRAEIWRLEKENADLKIDIAIMKD